MSDEFPVNFFIYMIASLSAVLIAIVGLTYSGAVAATTAAGLGTIALILLFGAILTLRGERAGR